MPLLLGLLALVPSTALLIKTTGEEARETVTTTAPNLVLLAAAGLGIYAAFRIMQKGKF